MRRLASRAAATRRGVGALLLALLALLGAAETRAQAAGTVPEKLTGTITYESGVEYDDSMATGHFLERATAEIEAVYSSTDSGGNHYLEGDSSGSFTFEGQQRDKDVCGYNHTWQGSGSAPPFERFSLVVQDSQASISLTIPGTTTYTFGGSSHASCPPGQSVDDDPLRVSCSGTPSQNPDGSFEIDFTDDSTGRTCGGVLTGAGTSIAGKVKDPAGDPVSGVNVTARGAGSDRTDADGEYSIDVPEKKKTYTVKPKQKGTDFTPEQRKVKVKPGKTARANFKIKGRLITGKVVGGCESSCPAIPTPIAQIPVKAKGGGKGKASAAKSYRAKTDTDGRYEMIVGKGIYQVSANAGLQISTPGQKRVNLKKQPKATADFSVCGFKGEAGASANIPRDIWREPQECRQIVKLRWRDSDTAGQGLNLIEWKGRPTCLTPVEGGFDAYEEPAKVIVGNKEFSDSEYTVTENRVDFQATSIGIKVPPVGYLDSSGQGRFRAVSEQGNCTYQIDTAMSPR